MGIPKKHVSEEGTVNWVDGMKTVTRPYSNTILSSTNLLPNQASLKRNERYVYQSLLDKSKEKNQKIN